ncbi:cell wall hydrolase [Planomicrobium sp. MB-3u-38]|uniref:cell wall hydrolase n=1 Tax=Planomicrobium sp. MB-3u-38 TaxID=2058318 RepID=UPI000C79D04C|nr:cell wall hydrolase [Planomicrobium sp. MB-3u-38]PKH10449.1 cell wall hydrolase [Planomicrobium sp. MB-3u-38]
MKFVKAFLFTAMVFAFLSFSQTETKAHFLDLHTGMAGEEVTALQRDLQKLGYFHVAPTGYFGEITKNALIGYQTDFGVPATGYYGPLTQSRMAETEIMARVVHGEARGEKYAGKVAVAAVILNRGQSPRFPDSIESVVFQRNAFTAVNDKQYYLVPDSSAYQAVKDAVKGWDPSHGATYYYNPSGVTDSWIFSRTTITKIGKHVFAK